MAADERTRADLAAIACCVSAVWLVFGPTRHFGFVNFDDPGYLTQNPVVRAGLSWQGVRWAFASLQEGHYHPLTWLSHMAMVQLFGLAPGPHHLANVALHALNASLLYWLFARLTGMRVHALLAALLFAVHPLRAESVAWVTERKDVLSTAFWLLACLAYARSVRTRSSGFFAAALGSCALGLLCKPILVALPLSLLVLDHWPLGRVRAADGGYPRQLARLSLEKLPFAVLGLGSLLITAYGQAHAGAIQDASGPLLTQRLANASSGYLGYLGQWLWPVGSSIFHPLRAVPPGLGVGSALALLAISQRVYQLRERAPALLAGWVWFVVTLLPVIGLVQIGGQARADRFTYVPSIGLGMLIVWGIPAALRVRPLLPQLLAAVAVLLPLASWARVEIAPYADSEKLWRHALATDPDNFMAHNNLGVELERQGRAAESEEHYREAVRLHPSYPPARSNLGNALARRGDYAAALPHFELALRRQPQLTEAHYNLGLTLAHLGRYEEAAEHYRQALRLTPGYAVAHYSLGALLVGLAHEPEGLGHLRRAVALEPSWAEPRAMLARLGAAP